MVGRAATIPGVKRAAPIVLLTVLILALGGCGSTETSSGEGETTSAETGGEGTTSAGTGGGAVPADIVSVTLSLTPSGDSGVGGTATLTDSSGGLEVTLNVRGLSGQPGVEHLAHVHESGTCADERAGNEAPVRYPLEPVITGRGGSGSSTTAIPDTTVIQLFSGAPKYVDVHAEATGDEAPPGVSCADIYTTTGGD
jgi:hypothetical protein